MAEYISREETVKAFCEKCKGYYDGHCIHRGECDIDVIKTAPVADVQLVVHAYWIELPKALNPNENPCKCSNCGHILSFMNGYQKVNTVIIAVQEWILYTKMTRLEL